jgi:excisionase family DNA binding protein
VPNERVNQDWVGYPDAQRLSGFNQGTLRRLIRNGQLRATKIGGAMMIDLHSLKKYMRDHGYAEQLRLFDSRGWCNQ